MTEDTMALYEADYALWDSAVNPFNSVKCGPVIDILREFTEACRRPPTG